MAQNLGYNIKEKQRIQATEMRVFRKIAGARRMDHVRNDNIRAQLRLDRRSCGAGGQKKRGLKEMGRGANWIYDRNGN